MMEGYIYLEKDIFVSENNLTIFAKDRRYYLCSDNGTYYPLHHQVQVVMYPSHLQVQRVMLPRHLQVQIVVYTSHL